MRALIGFGLCWIMAVAVGLPRLADLIFTGAGLWLFIVTFFGAFDE